MPCVCRDGGVYLFGQKYGVGHPMRTLGESGKVRKMVNQEIPQLESLVIHSTKTYTIEIPGCSWHLDRELQLSLSLDICLILETLMNILFL